MSAHNASAAAWCGRGNVRIRGAYSMPGMVTSVMRGRAVCHKMGQLCISTSIQPAANPNPKPKPDLNLNPTLIPASGQANTIANCWVFEGLEWDTIKTIGSTTVCMPRPSACRGGPLLFLPNERVREQPAQQWPGLGLAIRLGLQAYGARVRVRWQPCHSRSSLILG